MPQPLLSDCFNCITNPMWQALFHESRKYYPRLSLLQSVVRNRKNV